MVSVLHSYAPAVAEVVGRATASYAMVGRTKPVKFVIMGLYFVVLEGHFGLFLDGSVGKMGPDSVVVVERIGNSGGQLEREEACRYTGIELLGGHLRLVSALQSEGETAEDRSEEHTSELQSRQYLVCRLLLEKKKQK